MPDPNGATVPIAAHFDALRHNRKDLVEQAMQVGVAHRRDGEVGIIRQHDQETSREGIEERAEVQQFSLGYRTQAYNKACRSFQAA